MHTIVYVKPPWTTAAEGKYLTHTTMFWQDTVAVCGMTSKYKFKTQYSIICAQRNRVDKSILSTEKKCNRYNFLVAAHC